MVFPALLALAQAAPAIIGLFDSDNESVAAKAAKAVSSTAQAISGKPNDASALAALQADPAKMIEYQNAMNAHAATMYQSETVRLQSINETIRAEVASTDKYVSRMRPTMGYALIVSWSATMFAIVYAIIATPAEAPAVITAVAGLSMMWSVALSVLGLYVYKRSEDKKPPQVGVISSLFSRFASRDR